MTILEQFNKDRDRWKAFLSRLDISQKEAAEMMGITSEEIRSKIGMAKQQAKDGKGRGFPAWIIRLMNFVESRASREMEFDKITPTIWRFDIQNCFDSTFPLHSEPSEHGFTWESANTTFRDCIRFIEGKACKRFDNNTLNILADSFLKDYDIIGLIRFHDDIISEYKEGEVDKS